MEPTDTTRFSPDALFAAGRLSLDFINTSCERRGEILEFLGSGDDLLRWLRNAEVVHGRQLIEADEEWSKKDSEAALAEALELRAALHDLMESVVRKQPAPASALQRVNATLKAYPTYSEIKPSDGIFSEAALSIGGHAWLAAIAQDAVELLCHSDLTLLRQCECPTCVRVFFDTTKNHRRRWCVEKCGSAPKAAAYYRRKMARARLE